MVPKAMQQKPAKRALDEWIIQQEKPRPQHIAGKLPQLSPQQSTFGKSVTTSTAPSSTIYKSPDTFSPSSHLQFTTSILLYT
ncbi:hypothetical protein K443DRAFT_4102 [Laccaria amethystina LaAM-08-1]|uniref:Uncharacterized protein n=1 Tax=Laccaria amethystina LaAM-08-1 TaxID=1095629 RepID=A0A0C9XJ86_9AGAR|nr:hypothetical protein K443DRAFT_4102 [Laccaria amethystina LaAM-08-1]